MIQGLLNTCRSQNYMMPLLIKERLDKHTQWLIYQCCICVEDTYLSDLHSPELNPTVGLRRYFAR